MSRLLAVLAASGDTPAGASRYMPDVQVQVAWNAGYTTPAADRVWTDVSGYVELHEEIGIGFGRGDEMSTTDANNLTLTLDNSDGRFTMDRAASPYYPNVKIGRPIRVIATTVEGYTSVRYTGFVDEWPLEWSEGVASYAKTVVTATSRTARLGLNTALRSVPEEEMRRLEPVVYYTLGEAEGATFAADSLGNASARLTQAGTGNAVTFGTATGPPTDDLTAASFHQGKRLTAVLPVDVPAAGMSAVVAFNTAALTADTRTVLELPMSGGGIWIETDSFNGVRIGGWRLGPGPLLVHGSTASISAATTYVAAVTTSTGSLMTSYLDGVSIGTDGSWSLVGGSASRLNVGGGDGILAVRAAPDMFEGSAAHVAVFDRELSAAEVAAVSEAMLTGFLGETPAERLERYAAYAGISGDEVSSTADSTAMAHVDVTGMGVLDAMRVVEETEGGVLFDARDGDLTLQDRGHRYGASAAVTLSMTLQEVEADFQPKGDRTALVNVSIAATRDGTAVAEALDATSRDDYGQHRRDFELATTNSEEPAQRAWWTVNTYKEPRARVATLTVDLLTFEPARQAALLAATIGTRIDVTGIPAQAAGSSASYFVEGAMETIGPESYRITFNVSPAAVYDVWILDSPTHSQLGTTTRLAY